MIYFYFIIAEDEVEYVAFCDSGYALGHVFITPFSRRRNLTPEEREFNRYGLLRKTVNEV